MAKELKIIWVINIVLPEACQRLGLTVPVIGGWLSAYRETFRANFPQQKLTIVSPYMGKEPIEAEVNGDKHYLFPEASTTVERRQLFQRIVELIKPDIIHIHGSEYPHSFDFLSVCDSLRTVLSIQGLVSVYANYFYAGISFKDRCRHTTLRDFLRRETFAQQRQRFVDNGEKEQRLIANVGNVIGRTEWDRAHCRRLNPEVRYFKCNEPLRSEFYDRQWQRSRCFDQPTLFVSQANYPIKALHQLFLALPPVIKKYPNLRVHISGDNLLAAPTIKRTSYAFYLLRMAKKLNLTPHLHYLGRLDAKQMVEQYLGARAFISPSVIENSSNSVCEAQLLGTPVIASNVGGMADLIRHRQTGMLYRFEETAMLSDYILELLNHDDLCTRLSINERQEAQLRHNQSDIARDLMNIYQTMTECQ